MYSLRPETYKKIIERDQTSEYFFTDGEKLENEKKFLQLVLNGQPTTELRHRTETRLDEIARQLEETNMAKVNYEDLFDLIPYLNAKKHISFLPEDESIVHVLEQIDEVPVEYPPELLAARRAEFKSRLEQVRACSSRLVNRSEA